MTQVAEVCGRRYGLYRLRSTFDVGCGEGMACIFGGQSISRTVKVGPILGVFPIAQHLVNFYRGPTEHSPFSHSVPIRGPS